MKEIEVPSMQLGPHPAAAQQEFLDTLQVGHVAPVKCLLSKTFDSFPGWRLAGVKPTRTLRCECGAIITNELSSLMTQIL